MQNVGRGAARDEPIQDQNEENKCDTCLEPNYISETSESEDEDVSEVCLPSPLAPWLCPLG
jgi:hypothetical protein